jgi:hypothetical protein
LRVKYNAHTHVGASHTHVEYTAAAYVQTAVTAAGGVAASTAPGAGSQAPDQFVVW